MSESLLVVLPVLWDQPTDVCVESVLMPHSAAGFDADQLLLVDNSRDGFATKYGLRTYRDPDGHNLGVARAWNVGAYEVLDRGLDYLVLMSASMRFGPTLHTTWTRQMRTFWNANIIENTGNSWHLIAIHRRLFEAIGVFDGNFYPAYEESIDWCYRLKAAGMEGGWPNVWVNAMSQGAAMHNQMVSCPNAPLRRYYMAKWGGPKGAEQWDRPFGSMPLDWWEDLPIPTLAMNYGLEVWW